MKRNPGLVFVVVMLAGVVGSSVAPVAAQEYAADVPENVLTPDVVETATLGTLEFFDGMPLPETVKKNL